MEKYIRNTPTNVNGVTNKRENILRNLEINEICYKIIINKVLNLKRILVSLLAVIALPTSVIADVNVRGYLRRDGTYVQPYKRTRPNNTIRDNYSYPGNFNPNKYKPLKPYNPPPLKNYLQNYNGY